ncbi:methionyl-tRNA formyltransferase [Synechococcus sp. PCC 6312]|uniref:methionyl-tRNA formyltransferase n=1 Tax=Synechococcus sp. (strain ATCC 27167 / PCC 6312) TaxID=195253 RepID=UPI00029EEE6F|nr:methionyl-tRNA formyltransferase [Synechococcus sp. PCC 6312]AFY62152.1 methionyl-tRNA formyltransferase [Synechococcus sp. PCC 6312]
MRIIFFGTPDFAVPTLAALLTSKHQVLGVVTQPDKRRGRGSDLIPSPIKQLALDANLPIWQPTRIKQDKEVIEAIQACGAEVFVVVAYGQILSQEILDIPKLGCINNHASLLPRYRGAAPIQWALYHGEPETGITTMLMDAGMDTGAMLLTVKAPITLGDNAATLGERLAGLGADLLLETLAQVPSLTPIPQDPTQATYAPLIKKPDYELAWNRSALDLHNQVRGFYPNCQTQLLNQAIKITRTLPLIPDVMAELPEQLQAWVNQSKSDPQAVGNTGAILKGLGPVVQTGQGQLLIQEVQPAGKKRQSGWDFANGLRLTVGQAWG